MEAHLGCYCWAFLSSLWVNFEQGKVHHQHQLVPAKLTQQALQVRLLALAQELEQLVLQVCPSLVLLQLRWSYCRGLELLPLSLGSAGSALGQPL